MKITKSGELILALCHVFGNVYFVKLFLVEFSLGALEILNVVAQHEDELVVGGSALCLGDVNELAEQILGESYGYFMLVFHIGQFLFYVIVLIF